MKKRGFTVPSFMTQLGEDEDEVIADLQAAKDSGEPVLEGKQSADEALNSEEEGKKEE